MSLVNEALEKSAVLNPANLTPQQLQKLKSLSPEKREAATKKLRGLVMPPFRYPKPVRGLPTDSRLKAAYRQQQAKRAQSAYNALKATAPNSTSNIRRRLSGMKARTPWLNPK